MFNGKTGRCGMNVIDIITAKDSQACGNGGGEGKRSKAARIVADGKRTRRRCRRSDRLLRIGDCVRTRDTDRSGSLWWQVH